MSLRCTFSAVVVLCLNTFLLPSINAQPKKVAKAPTKLEQSFREPGFYWGMGKTVKPDKDRTRSSTLVLGKRTYDEAKDVVTDTQFYVSQNGPSSEYGYEFNLKNKQMTVVSEGKKVGGGTFELSSSGTCTYSYRVDGAEGYSAKGKDTFGGKGVLYTETSTMLYNDKVANPNPEDWSGEFLPLTETAFASLVRTLKDRK